MSDRHSLYFGFIALILLSFPDCSAYRPYFVVREGCLHGGTTNHVLLVIRHAKVNTLLYPIQCSFEDWSFA